MLPAQISKEYRFGGQDISSGEHLRDPQMASSMLNAMVDSVGALTCRPGFKKAGFGYGGSGAWTYGRVGTNGTTPEPIFASSTLNRLTIQTLTLAYVGPGLPSDGHGVKIYWNSTSSKWEMKFDTEAAPIDLGNGTSGAGINLTALAAWINLNIGARWTATLSGGGSCDAWFLPATGRGIDSEVTTFENYRLVDSTGAVVLEFFSFEKIPLPRTGAGVQLVPFVLHAARISNADWQLVSSVEINGIRYLSNGNDVPLKYDGIMAYRAGMSIGARPTCAVGGAGAVIAAGVYQYITTYVQVDAQGNEVEGIESLVRSVTVPVGGVLNIGVTLTNIQAASQFGWLTDTAIINGNQNWVPGPVTLNVTWPLGATQCFYVGQKVFLLNRTASAYFGEEITLTGVAAGTISFTATTAGNVNNLDRVSANLRIRVWRTAAAGNDFGLVAELPNWGDAASQVLTDVTPSGGEGATYINPADLGVEHGVPPWGAYLAYYQGSLCIGSSGQVNFSDVTSPEYFPAAFSFTLPSPAPGGISGLYSRDDGLLVFKDQSTWLVSGVLWDGTWRLDPISLSVGCVSKETIQDVEGVTVFLSEAGVKGFSSGKITDLSTAIDPAFGPGSGDWTRTYATRRAAAIYDPKNKLYILSIPVETVTVAGVRSPWDEKVFVMDLNRQGQWFLWDNMNFSGGVCLVDDSLLWAPGDSTSRLDRYVYQRNFSHSWADYVDHNVGISWNYISGWEDLGEPDVYKRWIWFKVSALSPGPTSRDMSINNLVQAIPHFTFTLATELDYAIEGTVNGTSASVEIAPAAVNGLARREARVKAKKQKARACRYKLSGTFLNSVPLISSLRAHIAPAYVTELKRDARQ